MWRRSMITYSKGNPTYTTPYCDTAWETAKEAIDTVTAITDALQKDVEILQTQIDKEISTWFYNYVPTLDKEPAVSWKQYDSEGNLD